MLLLKTNVFNNMSLSTPETYSNQVWDTIIIYQRLNDIIKTIIISFTDYFKLVRVCNLATNYNVVITEELVIVKQNKVKLSTPLINEIGQFALNYD